MTPLSCSSRMLLETTMLVLWSAARRLSGRRMKLYGARGLTTEIAA
jgi:hypothetical protein